VLFKGICKKSIYAMEKGIALGVALIVMTVSATTPAVAYML
jgi:hypothetical protein